MIKSIFHTLKLGGGRVMLWECFDSARILKLVSFNGKMGGRKSVRSWEEFETWVGVHAPAGQ